MMAQIDKYGLVVVFIWYFLCVPQVSQALINVPADYPTIQEALDNAGDGEKVLVQPGIYYEHLVLDMSKSYDLEGVDRETTIIDADHSGRAIDIGAGPDLSISNLTVQNSFNDGIYIFNRGFNFQNLIIKNNNRHGVFFEGERGFLKCYDKNIRILDSVITDNFRKGLYIDCNGGGIVHIENCEITYNHNHAIDAYSGYSNNNIKSSYIAHNDGGILWGDHYGAGVLINDITFEYNNYGMELGGGNDVNLQLLNSTIQYNSNFSIVVYARAVRLDVQQNTFQFNDSEVKPLIDILSYLDFSMNFSNNYVYKNSGDKLFDLFAGFTLFDYSFSNNTFVDNTLPATESVINAYADTFFEYTCKIKNNIIASNSCNGITVLADYTEIKNNNIYDNDSDQVIVKDLSTHTYTYNDMRRFNKKVPLAEGNISCDPLFRFPGDYHISAVSCCIDSGTDIDAPDTDLEGDPRPWGAAHDIGADENVFRDIPIWQITGLFIACIMGYLLSIGMGCRNT